MECVYGILHMLESGISPSQNVGHLEKQDACSGGHFAFEDAWPLFFKFFHVFVRYCRKIEKKKSDNALHHVWRVT